MGRNNQQRRAAKKRERDRKRRQHGATGGARSGQARPSGGQWSRQAPPDWGQRASQAPRGRWDGHYCWYHRQWHDDGSLHGGDGSLRGDGSIGDEPSGGRPFGDDSWLDDEDFDDEDLDFDEWFDDPEDGWADEENPYGDTGPIGASGGVDVHALLSTAVVRPGSVDADRALAALVRAGPDPQAWREATAEAVTTLDLLYEHGWQPADLMHVARKKLDTAQHVLIARTIQHDAALREAARRAPQEWCDQIDAIDDAHGQLPPGEPLALHWLTGAGRGVADAWYELVGALGTITHLSQIETLVDPPSRWPRERAAGSDAGRESDRRRSRPAGSSSGTARRGTPSGDHNPKMLAKIRALLAKAESTEFPDEAEALTGKAQDLMSRYAIDEAVLTGESATRSDIRARRVHIDSPYASTKVQLLASVGSANRVRVIWMDKVDIATVVGFPLELDLVEMLYTSLLVQATRAMTDEGRGPSGDRSVSFRRAFLLSYAQRIGERLVQASSDATAEETSRSAGAELVLARRSQEVDEEFERIFPHTRKIRTRRVNAHGWRAGRAAADRATIAHGQVGGDG